MERTRGSDRRRIARIIQWFDSYAVETGVDPVFNDRIELIRVIPYLALHAGCLGVIWVGWSPVAVITAIILYVIRMFAITGFYHRYFSHRAFRTGRVFQFLMAIAGCSACQRGPLWWAGHHRHHHQVADTPEDPHSPVIHGFLKSHMLWFLTNRNFRTRHDKVKDWRRYPELILLDRFDSLVPIIYALSLLGFGTLLNRMNPQLGTSGPQILVWGFFISTIACYHATYTINSLSHMYGYRRFDTSDHSRNNPLLSLITLGEGWHNNHHYYAVSARHGFASWEIDPTWLMLRVLAAVGLIYDLRPVLVDIMSKGDA